MGTASWRPFPSSSKDEIARGEYRTQVAILMEAYDQMARRDWLGLREVLDPRPVKPRPFACPLSLTVALEGSIPHCDVPKIQDGRLFGPRADG